MHPVNVFEMETGETIEVWPNLSPGESRDTEPGAQPWETTFVEYDEDHDQILVPAGEYFKDMFPDGKRPIKRECCKFIDRAAAFGHRNGRHPIVIG